MLSFSGSLRVFVAVEACDMRKGFEGLSALVGSVRQIARWSKGNGSGRLPVDRRNTDRSYFGNPNWVTKGNKFLARIALNCTFEGTG
jgi:hypothetical protein